ncbi:MAG TPA: hemerythrin domain-containing protein [Acidimicrobiia bacterium]
MADVVAVLKQDHRTVEKLFGEFETSRDRSIVERICQELDEHTDLEERIVYPALRSEVQGGPGMATHAEKEHAEARDLIGRIRRSEDFDHIADLVSELQQAVEEHVSDEENDVFPKMESEMGAARLEELGTEVESEKSG